MMKKEVKKELKRILKENDWGEDNYNKSNNIADLDWWSICRYYALSENFIREFKDYINWMDISAQDGFSDDFVKEFKDKLYLEEMLNTNRITKKLYNELKHGKPKSRYQLLDFKD